jgi:hypothetical protein
MRTLNTQEIQSVQGAGWFADLLAKVGKTNVKVDVVAKPQGSTLVTVTNNVTDVLVNVIWGKK